MRRLVWRVLGGVSAGVSAVGARMSPPLIVTIRYESTLRRLSTRVETTLRIRAGSVLPGQPQPPRQSMTYEESVLQYADHAGNLSAADADQLLSEHGFTLEDVLEDNHDVSWAALADRNAEAYLAWLGY